MCASSNKIITYTSPPSLFPTSHSTTYRPILFHPYDPISYPWIKKMSCPSVQRDGRDGGGGGLGRAVWQGNTTAKPTVGGRKWPVRPVGQWIINNVNQYRRTCSDIVSECRNLPTKISTGRPRTFGGDEIVLLKFQLCDFKKYNSTIVKLAIKG